MYIVLSPAKNLDEKTTPPPVIPSHAALLEHSDNLMQQLRTLAPQDLAQLMHVSDKIAQLNYTRNQTWQLPFTPDNAKPAIFLFKGDVYEGIDAYNMANSSLDYLQEHLGLLSGLYGLLKPFDLIQPYRLEMGTAFANTRGKNLYEFWQNTITDLLNQRITQSNAKTLVNLASQEYFKSVNTKQLAVPMITPIFKDEKNGQYKIISFYAKRARGLMTRFAAEEKIQRAEDLKAFNLAGYAYNEAASNEKEWVFLRSEQTK